MIDLNQLATVAGLSAFLVLLVQYIVKPAVPADKAPLIPLFAIILGVISALAVGFGLHSITSFDTSISWIIGGIESGLAAIGIFEGFKQATK